MKTKTFQKLDLAAQRIAGRLISIKGNLLLDVEKLKKPYLNVKQFILDNQEYFDRDMYGVVSMKNVCKTTRQVHYLTNEVLHRLRRDKFFKNPASSDPVQMLLPL